MTKRKNEEKDDGQSPKKQRSEDGNSDTEKKNKTKDDEKDNGSQKEMSVDKSASIDSKHSKEHTPEDKENDWKNRAPYRHFSKAENFKALYEGSCHCGKVVYHLSRKEPLASKLCHCSTCQTLHAAPFQHAAIFEKTDIDFLHGANNLQWYDTGNKAEAHTLPCKVLCSHCHSPIMDEGRKMILLYPSLIHFKSKEDKELFKPKCHIFYDRRVLDINDDLKKWKGLDKDEEWTPENDEK